MKRRLAKICTAVALCLGMVLGLGALSSVAAPRPTPPSNNDSSNETVYLVKGFNSNPFSTGVSCQDRWNPFIPAMRSWGWTGNFIKVGFYTGDAEKPDCDINLAERDGTRDLSLKELGRRLAWNIHLNYSRQGKSVDLVGHSMGGLIVRAALLGVERHQPGDDWPPYIYVEDAVTLGTPHYGISSSKANCIQVLWARQCREMVEGSRFVYWLNSTGVPQSRQRTDWTFIGSNADELVSRNSATPTTEGAQHLVRYAASMRIRHSQLRILTRGPKTLYYSPRRIRWTLTTNGDAPVREANKALYWASKR